MPLGILILKGRYLRIGAYDPFGSESCPFGLYRLGDDDDDVSSLYIIQHLLKTNDAKRRAAIESWLTTIPLPVRTAKPANAKDEPLMTPWPNGLFNQLRDGWVYEPFERPPLCDFEAREDWSLP